MPDKIKSPNLAKFFVIKNWLQSSLFCYFTLFLVQLKAVWGMWHNRDLTFGDTSYYFLGAHNWHEGFPISFIWSPLYTAFYGSFLIFSKDVPYITMLHRLFIVFTATLLVFAIMRRFLPKGLAWMMSAWWAVLPTNYNALYEVHLFAMIPVLAALTLVLYFPSTWVRASAVALLFTASFLLRNELLISTVLLFACCLWWELRLLRESKARRVKDYGFLMTKYLAFLGASIVVCFFFFWRSDARTIRIDDALHSKHTINLCQTFAFGYKQRHPEWTKDPFTQCDDIMMETFGKSRPTLSEALKANSSAVFEHFIWNIRLIPSGFQILLFNAAYGSMNPDYISVHLNRTYPLVLSLLVCILIIFSSREIYRKRQWWLRHWFQERAFSFLSLLSLVLVAAPVMLTQRPRPSYLFNLSMALLILIGTCLYIISTRWSKLERLVQGKYPMFPIFMILTIIAAPSLLSPYSSVGIGPSRPLYDEYRRLAPFEQIIATKRTVFLKGEHAQEIRNYIGLGRPRVLDYSVLSQLSQNERIEDFLVKRGINLFYVDESLYRRLNELSPHGHFISSTLSNGWKELARGIGGSGRWILLQKVG